MLRAPDVLGLAAFIAATEQNDDLPAVQPVIDTQAGTDGDSQTSQAGIDRDLRLSIAERIELLIEWDEAALKLQLLDLPLNHRATVSYR